jgi:hypothetical protein
MKYGKNIVDLAHEIQRQAEAARDYVADTRTLDFRAPVVLSGDGRDVTVPTVVVPNEGDFTLSDHAQNQIAGRLGIPTKYFGRMRDEAPALLEQNVKHWMANGGGRVMLRTLDGRGRAVLSDRYLRLDNLQIAEMALPALLGGVEHGTEILSCDVTESRLYIAARFRRVEGEVEKGDPVQMGLIITNSEIGMGAVDVRPLVYRLVCKNGMVAGSIIEDARVRRMHLGAKIGGEGLIEYAADTVAADATALSLQIRDQVAAMASGELLNKFIERARVARQSERVEHPVAAVEVLGRSFGFSNREREGILTNLIRDSDMSLWGMANAVTRLAHDAADYDRNVELQELGGRVLSLAPSEWRRIAEAENLKAAA